MTRFSQCLALEGLEKDNFQLYANTTYFLGMITHIQGQYVVSGEHFQEVHRPVRRQGNQA